MPAGDQGAGEDDIGAAARALFRLVRRLSRQPASDGPSAHPQRARDLSRILVLQAVEATGAASVAEGQGAEVSVGAVAAELGVDPSTASRLVAETIRAGYLARAPSSADGRRQQLALTPAGHRLAWAARRYQRDVFEQATVAWSAADRQYFARLLVPFAAALIAADRREPTDAAP